MTITQKPVRNFWKGRGGYTPKAVVIHIAQGYLAGAHSWFNNPRSQASSHYMVGRNGEIWQFVDEADSAWHAGGISNPSILFSGNFPQNVNPNLFTIGIEHEGFTGERWPIAQRDASAWLIAEIHKRWKLGNVRYPQTIIGHNEINSTSRSTCPGNGVHITKDLINPANALLADSRKDDLYKVFSGSKQLCAFEEKDNAFDLFIEKGKQVKIILNGDDVTQEFITMANTLERKITQLETDITRLKAQNAALQDEVADLTKDKSNLKREIDKFERDYNSLAKDNEKLKREILNLRNGSSDPDSEPVNPTSERGLIDRVLRRFGL